MANVEMMVENLEKANESAGLAMYDLDSALKNADAVQAILILEMTTDAVNLQARIARLLSAVKSED